MLSAIDKDAWQHGAQVAEWEHWRNRLAADVGRTHEHARSSARDLSRLLWERFRVRPEDWSAKIVVDIGCGPTARCAAFQQSQVFGIDPLLDRYRELPGGLLQDYARLYALPAEHHIMEVDGLADFAVCMNCLDHCYDPRAVIGNMAAYMKDGGSGFLSVDINVAPSVMHPLRITCAGVESLLSQAGLIVMAKESGKAYPIIHDRRVTGWQNGWSADAVASHWWFAKKREK